MNGEGGGAPWWAEEEDALLRRLGSARGGLSSEEAARRLPEARRRALERGGGRAWIAVLAAQFSSPIVALLGASAALSLFLREEADALIILAILLTSGLLGFRQEWRASRAVERLLGLVRPRATALRDGREREVPADEIVPGDVVLLRAGSGAPGDCRILEAGRLFVDESALTGESFPAEKAPGAARADAPPSERTGALFLGTHVASGSARALVALTGRDTEFGAIAGRLRLRAPETEFERGLKAFGRLLLDVTILLTVGVLAVNLAAGRPAMESFLFSLALAVGLTPQLLPAVVSVNLSHGARRMAERKVVVRRLASIENFGAMTVLCADKTGTLTEGRARLLAALDPDSAECAETLLAARLNAALEEGYVNPVAEALRAAPGPDLSGWRKVDELPYDFVRKRASVLAEKGAERRLATVGAVRGVLDACSRARSGAAEPVPLSEAEGRALARFEELSARGLRCLGVAVRDAAGPGGTAEELKRGMDFLGFVVLEDPPKPDAAATVRALAGLGVALKIVTGDNRLAARAAAERVGIASPRIVTGEELRATLDEALPRLAADASVFAEVEPNQKERIVLALRRGGAVVGFLGDGVNDAPALHAADVGVSVEGAADAAKEAADVVLLEKDLGVLVGGVEEGRRTFANTLKYVLMAAGANFGNMFSVAGAALFLPFLPLLPKQILLANLLTDLPEMAVAADRVDPEAIARPRRWDVGFIRRFMLYFGLLSSLFDYLTFGALLFLGADPARFRAAWFVESVASAALVVLAVRTRRPLARSVPAPALLAATALSVSAAAALPWSPLAAPLGFAALGLDLSLAVLGITALYIASAEAAKAAFYRRAEGRPA